MLLKGTRVGVNAGSLRERAIECFFAANHEMSEDALALACLVSRVRAVCEPLCFAGVAKANSVAFPVTQEAAGARFYIGSTPANAASVTLVTFTRAQQAVVITVVLAPRAKHNSAIAFFVVRVCVAEFTRPRRRALSLRMG